MDSFKIVCTRECFDECEEVCTCHPHVVISNSCVEFDLGYQSQEDIKQLISLDDGVFYLNRVNGDVSITFKGNTATFLVATSGNDICASLSVVVPKDLVKKAFAELSIV